MEAGRQVRLLLEAHLQQQRELTRHMRAQLQPAIEAQRAMQESFRQTLAPILEQQELWTELIGSLQMPQVVLPDMSGLAAQVAQLRESVLVSIGPALEAVRRTFAELPPRTRAALLTLGKHGWFLDLRMPLPDLWGIESALIDGHADEAEQALCAYFEGRLDDIEASVCVGFPARAHLLGAAFRAHRAGDYDLSIPVLLAQADGICKDITDQYFFIRRGPKDDRRPATAVYVERVTADSIRAALLSPLAETLPITQSQSERDDGFDLLNRHMVLHGESLDYGTKVNGLRAISLVNYVAGVLGYEPETTSSGEPSREAPVRVRTTPPNE